MLTLYIANKNYSSWSLRLWVLLKELQIPFEEILVPFGSGSESGGFAAFSPTGRVPCIVDEDTTVWDSLSITEYLAEEHPAIWPADRTARSFARSACAEMHSGFSHIRDICTMNCGIRVKLGPMSGEHRAEWDRMDALWNEGLDRLGGPYLAGDAFTAVDAFFAPVAFRVQSYSPELSDAGRAYVQRLLDLPAMQEWYAAALKETWRDQGHEDEARAAGKWLEDFRATA